MYYWRRLTPEQREEVLRIRKGRGLPWHSPPHFEGEGPVTYLITGTCFEHKSIIGLSDERLEECETELLSLCGTTGAEVLAWCVLPNHYHILLKTDDLAALRMEIGRFHGRSARAWNLEDDALGRKVWFNFMDRKMRSARHFWASLNYVHHNPVKHGYVEKWKDWPYSSATRYLEGFGREKAEFIWKKYPVLDYGTGWDD